MAQAETYPTERVIALHLLGGIWIASCLGCGFELAQGHDQDLVEGWAALTTCTICQEDGNG